MAVHHSLKPRKFQLELRTSETSAVHGGQLAISGLLRQSGFFDWIADYRALNHRKDSSRGFDPEVYMIACLYSSWSSGSNLADIEELNHDKALFKLPGVKKSPEQSALGEWLRSLGANDAFFTLGATRVNSKQSSISRTERLSAWRGIFEE
jgi:hypothetical protein